jgi:hypothetical protein
MKTHFFVTPSIVVLILDYCHWPCVWMVRILFHLWKVFLAWCVHVISNAERMESQRASQYCMVFLLSEWTLQCLWLSLQGQGNENNLDIFWLPSSPCHNVMSIHVIYFILFHAIHFILFDVVHANSSQFMSFMSFLVIHVMCHKTFP